MASAEKKREHAISVGLGTIEKVLGELKLIIFKNELATGFL